MIGGFAAWKRAGFPIESSRQAPRVGRVILGIVDRLTTRGWLLSWVALVVLCSVCYWALSGTFLGGLTTGGAAIPRDAGGLATSFYFSVVRATCLGYGDVVPVGLSRFLAIAESAAGLLVFGAILAKLLSHRQRQLIEESETSEP